MVVLNLLSLVFGAVKEATTSLCSILQIGYITTPRRNQGAKR